MAVGDEKRRWLARGRGQKGNAIQRMSGRVFTRLRLFVVVVVVVVNVGFAKNIDDFTCRGVDESISVSSKFFEFFFFLNFIHSV